MILIFKKKTIFICLFSYLLNLINCKVLITSPSKSYLITKLEKLGIKKKCNTLLYLDMSLPKITNLGEISGDYNKISNKCVEDLYNRIDFLEKFRFFFFNVNDLEKKLKIIIYQYFDQLFASQQHIIAWLESSVYRDNLIINFSALKPGAKNIWRKSNLKFFFVLNYCNYFIGLLGKTLFLINKNLIKSLCNKFKLIIKKNDTNNQSLENNNFHQNDVIFFPHNGLVTFGIPPKDYFYSDKIESPFHPSKIMHLEYDNRVDIELEKQKIKKYLKINFINYKKFNPNYIPWLSGIKLIIEIFLTIDLFKFKNLGSNLLFYSIIFNTYIFFKRNRNFLKYYKNAKIAFVGYEVLFPKPLALALESLDIKTIGVAERFFMPYINSQTFILDTLLSVSELSSKIIKQSDRFYVHKIFPVGQVRSDHFFDNVIIERGRYRKKRILVLDHHIADDIESEKFYISINWKNDIYFRNEILLLAQSYPEIEFIFRGKNCNWYKNKQHDPVISKINKLSNVSVDTDYSINHWKSYHLCVSSDLIIARPTSLAEECVSKGMNVIVYDYGINYKTSVKKFLPNLLKEYYCSSFEQLNSMIKFWIKNQIILTDKKKNEITEKIFSNLTDGNVRYRIQKYLNQIYSEL